MDRVSLASGSLASRTGNISSAVPRKECVIVRLPWLKSSFEIYAVVNDYLRDCNIQLLLQDIFRRVCSQKVIFGVKRLLYDEGSPFDQIIIASFPAQILPILSVLRDPKYLVLRIH